MNERYIPAQEGDRLYLERRAVVACAWSCQACGEVIPEKTFAVLNEIEERWTKARFLYGDQYDRRMPAPTTVSILMEIYDGGAAHGTELARRAGQAQGNVTALILPKLHRFDFVDWSEEALQDRNGQERPVRVWRLTHAGRELVALLRAASELAHRCTH